MGRTSSHSTGSPGPGHPVPSRCPESLGSGIAAMAYSWETLVGGRQCGCLRSTDISGGGRRTSPVLYLQAQTRVPWPLVGHAAPGDRTAGGGGVTSRARWSPCIPDGPCPQAVRGVGIPFDRAVRPRPSFPVTLHGRHGRSSAMAPRVTEPPVGAGVASRARWSPCIPGGPCPQHFHGADIIPFRRVARPRPPLPVASPKNHAHGAQTGRLGPFTPFRGRGACS